MKRREHELAAETRACLRQAALATLFSAFAASAPASAMPADAQNPANRESVAIGRKAAQTYCARCHAIGRTGASPNRKSPPLRRVAHKYRNKSISSVLIIDGTVVRHKGMPQFDVSVEEADGLIAYIRSLERRRR